MTANPFPTITISQAQARRTALACQMLFPPRSLQGKEGVKEYLKQVRSIQFDPINVVGRNPDLVLQSRVRDFQPALLDDLLYQDRFLIDNWDKMASLSVVDDWPYFARHRQRMEKIFGIPSDVVMSLAPEVLQQIHREGPQSSLDFEFDRKTDWAWGPTRVARASLEGLFKMGQLGIHHRVNNRRYFDLIENLLSGELLGMPDPNVSLEAYQRWHVLRRIGGIGLAHPNAGEQWGGIIGVKSARRREIIKELIERGDLLAVQVAGSPRDTYYLRREDQHCLEQGQQESPPQMAAFLAPLDNLLWDRKTLQRLFDFDYVWEVYKPKKKRKYGYYVLPVLYEDRLIARLDPSYDKKTGLLTINNWWWEPGEEVNQQMEAALHTCFQDFLKYLNADSISMSKSLRDKKGLDWMGGL